MYWNSFVAQWVKYPALALQWFRLLLWWGLDPWPRELPCFGCGQNKKPNTSRSPSSVHRKCPTHRTSRKPWCWSQNTTPTQRNRGSLEKWLIPGLRQEMYKIRLDHPLPESKEAFKDDWSYIKKTGANFKRLKLSKQGSFVCSDNNWDRLKYIHSF